MQIKTVFYSPLQPPFALEDIKATLPQEVRKRLITTRQNIYVEVDANDVDTVTFLDVLFEIEKSDKFLKRVELEIGRDEIDDYDYFLVAPKYIELGKGCFGEVHESSCKFERACPIGSSLVLPVSVTHKLNNKLGILGIGRAWGMHNEFLISSKLKHLLNQNNISDLEYTQCVMYDAPNSTDNSVPPYFAKPIHTVTDSANNIFFKQENYCETHSLVFSYRLQRCQINRSELDGKDFVCAQGVVVGKKYYNYRQQKLIVSRRVLKILLQNRISGLTKMAPSLGNKFLPIMPTNSDVSLYNYN